MCALARSAQSELLLLHGVIKCPLWHVPIIEVIQTSIPYNTLVRINLQLMLVNAKWQMHLLITYKINLATLISQVW